MKRLSLTLLLAPAMLGTPAVAQDAPAQPAVTMMAPEYGGNGCPQGSSAASLSPDGQKMAVLFDSYTVEAGGPNGRALGRGTCSLAIAVDVPPNVSIAVFSVDFLGFNLLPDGATSQFRAEYFFAGDQGVPIETDFTGPLSADFVVQNPIAEDALVWSACGEDVILRANTSVLLRSGDQPAITNIAAAVGYRLRTKAC